TRYCRPEAVAWTPGALALVARKASPGPGGGGLAGSLAQAATAPAAREAIRARRSMDREVEGFSAKVKGGRSGGHGALIALLLAQQADHVAHALVIMAAVGGAAEIVVLAGQGRNHRAVAVEDRVEPGEVVGLAHEGPRIGVVHGD